MSSIRLLMASFIALAACAASPEPGVDAAAHARQGLRSVGVLGSARVDAAAAHPIPPSFLGLAHEWIPLAYTAESTPAGLDPVYVQLLRHVFGAAAGPLSFRIGGDTQDKLAGPPPAAILAQLQALHGALGAQIVFGLDLKSDRAALSAAQLDTGAAALSGAVTTWELGNEPDLYPLPFATYAERFERVAAQLPAAASGRLGGPSHSGMMPLADFDAFARAQAERLNLLEMHAYLGRASDAAIDVAFMLDEAQAGGWAQNFAPYVHVARAHGLPLRISEMNSLSGFGKAGVSDTFAAALWTADILFELMHVGLDGVNLTGSSTQIYAAIKDLPDPRTGARISRVGAPYYGLLLFAAATARGGEWLQADVTGATAMKVWATRDPTGIEHVVVINKDCSTAGFFALSGLRPHSQGELVYLQGPAAAATSGITFAGQSYDDAVDGNPRGARTAFALPDDGSGGFVVPLAACQAALLSVTPAES